MLVDFGQVANKNKGLISKLISTYKALTLVRANTNDKTAESNCNNKKIKSKEINNFCESTVNTKVIELTKEFRKIAGYELKDNIKIVESKSKHDQYDTFEEYILNNSKNNTLPKNADIENDLQITERERKKYRDMAIEKGIIKKMNSRVFVLNI